MALTISSCCSCVGLSQPIEICPPALLRLVKLKSAGSLIHSFHTSKSGSHSFVILKAFYPLVL